MKKNEVLVASILGAVALSAAVVGFMKRKFIKQKFQQARKRIFGNRDAVAYVPDPAPDPASEPAHAPKPAPEPAPEPKPEPAADDTTAETMAAGGAPEALNPKDASKD